MNKTIYFLLPGKDVDQNNWQCVPVGGYKVVYEYANRLAQDGNKVILAYSHTRCNESFLKCIKTFVGYYYRKAKGQLKSGEYFSFHDNVKKIFPYRFSSHWLNVEHDAIVVATSFFTSVELNKLKCIPIVQKYHFIQGHELWEGTEDDLDASYRFGMHNIVIAPWLQEKVEQAGAKATLITNGFNFEEFTLMQPIDSRQPHEIVMLNHTLDHKRCKDSWAALELVKRQVPDLHVTMFGTCPAPQNMPSWYTYFQSPIKSKLNEIYNNGAIYVAASDFEGFGLTIGEAMICGCAVACTNNGGFTCMAKDDDTALVSEVYDVEALATNVLRLIKDNALRLRIATSGNCFIQNFSWNNSYLKLKSLIDA
jgi:glycosyltransferase involved in cell wall biosynthesis